MKKNKKRKAALALFFAACILAFAAANPSSAEAASKPKQVKNVKVVKTTEGTVKVKFGKVKGAEYYQILIFQAEQPTKYPDRLQTPLVYAPKTKKTTYTIKHLIGDTPYTVKVRAYKNGQYGKMSKAAKCRTKGVKNLQYICNSCCVRLPYYEGPGSDKPYGYLKYSDLHHKAVYEVYSELHCGATLY